MSFNFSNENLMFTRRLTDGTATPITPEMAENTTLEDGNHIPDLQGNHTQINHYISRFWFHLLGPVPSMILFQLYAMCYGKTKNHAWPKVDTLALYTGISARTVQRNISILMKHKLVEVLDVWNKKTKKNETNIYFVRRTTPYLSEELYNRLPLELQKEHDEFIAGLVKTNYVQTEHVPLYKKQIKPSEPAKKAYKKQGDNLSPLVHKEKKQPAQKTGKKEGDKLSPYSPTICHPNNTNLNNTKDLKDHDDDQERAYARKIFQIEFIASQLLNEKEFEAILRRVESAKPTDMLAYGRKSFLMAVQRKNNLERMHAEKLEIEAGKARLKVSRQKKTRFTPKRKAIPVVKREEGTGNQLSPEQLQRARELAKRLDAERESSSTHA